MPHYVKTWRHPHLLVRFTVYWSTASALSSCWTEQFPTSITSAAWIIAQRRTNMRNTDTSKRLTYCRRQRKCLPITRASCSPKYQVHEASSGNQEPVRQLVTGCCKTDPVSMNTVQIPDTEQVQALANILRLALCCHSNETPELTANLPNSAQLEGTPYHSPNLHPGPCSSVGMRRGTDTQTHSRLWSVYISPQLCLMRNVMITTANVCHLTNNIITYLHHSQQVDYSKHFGKDNGPCCGYQ